MAQSARCLNGLVFLLIVAIPQTGAACGYNPLRLLHAERAGTEPLIHTVDQNIIHGAEYVTILQLFNVHMADFVIDVQFISRRVRQFFERRFEVAFITPGFKIPTDIRICVCSRSTRDKPLPSQSEQPKHKILHGWGNTLCCPVMIDAACTGPMEFLKSHMLNGFHSRIVIIGILGQQLAPDILQTMPVVLELEQHGDHLGLEHLRIIGCRQTSSQSLRTGLGLKKQRVATHHFQPCGTRIRGCIRHQFRGGHGEFIGCEHRTICQFKIQQPVVFGILDFVAGQIHQEFRIRLFNEHTVSCRERVMVQRNQFNIPQLGHGCGWADQPFDIVDVRVLIVLP